MGAVVAPKGTARAPALYVGAGNTTSDYIGDRSRHVIVVKLDNRETFANPDQVVHELIWCTGSARHSGYGPGPEPSCSERHPAMVTTGGGLPRKSASSIQLSLGLPQTLTKMLEEKK